MVITKFSKVTLLLVGLLLLLVSNVSPTAGPAQTRAQKSIIIQLLWQNLLKCYSAPEERVTADDEVLLRVELNTHGDLANLPDLMAPPKLSAGERALLREGTIALINCTPVISGGGEKSIYGRFEMVLNRDGLSLANVDAAVGRAEVMPTLDSLEIEEPEPETEEPSVGTTSINTPTGVLATLESETALGLTRSERQEIQRRLVLLDYNTRGVDGVFGKGSRAAIGEWQGSNGIPVSGYLDLNQIAKLREMSQEAYLAWDSRPKRYTDKNGCLREPNGTIIQGRSFNCDLAAASQSLGLSR